MLTYVPPEVQGGGVPGWVLPAVIGVAALLAVMIYIRWRSPGD